MTELQEIQLVYDVHAACQVKAHKVSEPQIASFSLSLRRVSRSLSRNDPFFALLAPVRRYGYLLATSILPVNHPQLYPSDGLEQLKRERARVAASYPRMVEDFDELIRSLVSLRSYDKAPLLIQMNRIAGKAPVRSQAILIRDTEYLLLVRETLSKLWGGQPPEVVTAQHLMELRCFDRLFVSGPASRYPDHVLRAPRARYLDIVRYDWTRDEVQTGSLFVKPIVSPIERENITTSSIKPEIHESAFDLEELNPVVDVGSVARQYGTHNHQEIVEARLVLLEGGSGVFLEPEDMLFAVNPTLPEYERIERVPLSSLAEGDYLILRTEGGGDHVAKVADGILGENASILRKRQEVWKSRLQEQVRLQGISKVASQLTRLGAKYADSANIRNWMAQRNLGPGTDGDFRAVLEFVGLGENIQAYLQALQNLRRAHRKAGHEIRRQLIEQIGCSDMKPLEREGFMEVTLPGEHGGRLGIYRILSMPQETARVSYRYIGHIINIGG